MIDANRSVSARYLESILCAWASALLISISHLRPEFWFVSLFALIPFLWRAIRVRLFESVLLGAVLATTYCLISINAASWQSLDAFLIKLLLLNVFFALYGIVVNRIASRVGFDAIFIIAVLWLPIEYVLSHYTRMGSILCFPEANSALLTRVGSLFGVLTISFLVVFINSLILIVSESFVRASCHGASLGIPGIDDQRFCPTLKEFILEKRWYYFLSPRAPPLT